MAKEEWKYQPAVPSSFPRRSIVPAGRISKIVGREWMRDVRSRLDPMTKVILDLSAYAPLEAILHIPHDAMPFRARKGTTYVNDHTNGFVFEFPHRLWERAQRALGWARIECLRNAAIYPHTGQFFFSTSNGKPLTVDVVFKRLMDSMNAVESHQKENPT